MWRCSSPLWIPSAPVGLSLWAYSAKQDSVYRVHRNNQDCVPSTLGPGMYQVATLGHVLWGQGSGETWVPPPHPPPSLHCIPDETCSVTLLGKGPSVLRHPSRPPTLPEPGPPPFGNWAGGGGSWWEMGTRGDVYNSLCLPVNTDCRQGKELLGWHPFLLVLAFPSFTGEIEVFFRLFL
jgi:hypothetical protein